MNTLPAIRQCALVPYDDRAFEVQSLQWQVRELAARTRETQSQLDGATGKMAMVSAFMAFRNRDLRRVLEQQKIELRALLGQPYEEPYEPEDPDSIIAKTNTPKEKPQRERAPRFIEKELKEVFRKISSRCHPDKTTDENLREFMPIANDFYAMHDLDTLKLILESAEDYLKSKKNRKKMSDLFMSKANELKGVLKRYRLSLERVLNSRQYLMVRYYESGDFTAASGIYEELLYENIADVKVKIAQIKGQRRVRENGMPALFKGPLPEFLKERQ